MSSFCIICSDKFSDSDDHVIATKCGHIYHFSCITRWFGENRTCPQCRAVLPEPDEKLLRLYFIQQNDDSAILNCDTEILTLRDTCAKKDVTIDSLNELIKRKRQYLKKQEIKYAKELSKYQKKTKRLQRAVTHLSSVEKKVIKLEQENCQMKNNLEGLKDVQAAVCGCRKDVQAMVNKCLRLQNIELLATVCIQLKQTNEIILGLTQQHMEDYFPTIKKKRMDNTSSESAASDLNMTPGSSKSHEHLDITPISMPSIKIEREAVPDIVTHNITVKKEDK